MNAPLTHIDPASPHAVRDALAAYLLQAGEGQQQARFVALPTPLGNGFDSFIYAFQLAPGSLDTRWSKPLVLRLQGAPEHADKAKREADVQRFLAEANYPVPALLATEDAANAFGLPFTIMERISGDTMLARITRNPLRAGGLLARLGRLHAALHRLPTSGWPLEHDTEPIARRKLAEIRHRVERSHLAGFENGLAWLERFAGTALPEIAAITHNDYHPLNVLVADNASLSVIDWSEACLGDRHHDIARTLTLFSFAYIVASSRTERILLKAARGFLRSRYLNGYERAFPVDRRRLAYFEVLQSFYGMAQLTEPLEDNLAVPKQAQEMLARSSRLSSELARYTRQRMAAAERVLASSEG